MARRVLGVVYAAAFRADAAEVWDYVGAESPDRADAIIDAVTEAIALLVEVKGRSGVSIDWVVQLRRNMLAHGRLPPAPFFLVVLADRFYLWTDDDWQNDASAPSRVLRRPDVEGDAAPELEPFVESVGLDIRALSGSSLQLVVLSWLGTLLAARDSDTDHADWVRSSGLLDAVRGGRVDAEALLA